MLKVVETKKYQKGLIKIRHKKTVLKELRKALEILVNQKKMETLSFKQELDDQNKSILSDFLIQKQNLIYIYPEEPSILSAHFYAPVKEIGPFEIKTLWANILVLWGMAMAMIILLLFDGLNKLSAWISTLKRKN